MLISLYFKLALATFPLLPFLAFSLPTPPPSIGNGTNESITVTGNDTTTPPDDLDPDPLAQSQSVIAQNNELIEKLEHRIFNAELDEGQKVLPLSHVKRHSTQTLGDDTEKVELGNRLMYIEDDSDLGLDPSQIITKLKRRYDTDPATGAKYKFYPAWTYFGFFSPKFWHTIDMRLFTLPKFKFQKSEEAAMIKQHGSSIKICNEKVQAAIQVVKKNKQKFCIKVFGSDTPCQNFMPSPINILTSEAEENENYRDFAFTHYDDFYAFQMFFPDDGTDLLTLKFMPPQNMEALEDEGNAENNEANDDEEEDLKGLPEISKGSIGSHTLFLDRILFHVGSNSSVGSEHYFNNEAYAMEIQLYFAPENLTYWEALAQYTFMNDSNPRKGKNVHVLSVMVKVAKPGFQVPGDPDASFAVNFETLSLAAKMFWRSENRNFNRIVLYSGKLLALEDFLKAPLTGHYYTYEGSLTHPPCLTNVMWNVFEKPIWITHDQWERFAFIYSEFSDLKYISGNFRPLDSITAVVDDETFTKMRLAQGEGEVDTKTKDKAIHDFTEGVYWETSYHQYQLYFAHKVWKSKKTTEFDDQEEGAQEELEKEKYDYYENDVEKAGSPQLRGDMTLIILKLIFELFLTIYN